MNFIRFYIDFEHKGNTDLLEKETQQITEQPKNVGIKEAIKTYIAEKAEEKGKIEGKMENQLEACKKMLQKGLPEADITDIPGVDKAFIEKLGEKMN